MACPVFVGASQLVLKLFVISNIVFTNSGTVNDAYHSDLIVVQPSLNEVLKGSWFSRVLNTLSFSLRNLRASG